MTKHPNTDNRSAACGRWCHAWRLKLGASLVLGVWCLVLLLSPSARAQSYSINWFTIDGGGGTSTGGVYSVSGTTNPIIVPATLPTKFYRVFKP